jgi:hypothetical protein
MADKDDLYDFKRGFKLLTRLPANFKPFDISRLPQGSQATMSDASPPKGAIPGFRYSSGGLTNEGLTPFTDIDFNDLATPWERDWSRLCNGGGTFKPVVVETTLLRQLGMGTVAGHRGSVGCDSLVQYGSPTIDRSSGWMGGNGMVWVADRSDPSLPEGISPYGAPQTTYDVLTTMDGQVLAVLGVIDREALEDANWIIDLVVAPLAASVLVKLAAGAVRLCTALIGRWEARAARNLLAGLTEDVAKDASELNFEVLAEGAPIPGTSVPETMRIRVGEREFNLTRNAAKIDKGTGQPIGPATKHLAEEVKRGPWNDLRVRKGEVIMDTNESNVWLRQNQVDFPMSSLASGLQVAERQILKKALLPLEGTTGVYKVLVEGWEFMIDTTKAPWVVYHAVIR